MNCIRSLLTLGTFALTFGGATTAESEELRIGTASRGGTYYPVGQAISMLVGNHAAGLTMAPVVTQGSVQDARLVNSGEVDIAITNDNLSVLANEGAGPYRSDGAMSRRAIGSLHASLLHIMTLDGSDIKGISDLHVKRIAVGPEGGGTIPFLGQVLGLHGMTIDDITPSYLSHADGFSQLADGYVDAAFALSGYPAEAVMQAQANAKLMFIPLSDATMADALEKYSNYNKVIVPADVYGTDAEGSLLSVNNMLIVDAGMDEGTAYQITQAIYDHMDEFPCKKRTCAPDRSGSIPVAHDPAKSGCRAVFQQVGRDGIFQGE